MPSIKLMSSDGCIFDVDTKAVRCSITIANVIDDLEIKEGEIVPVPNVESRILEKIVCWAHIHKDDPQEHEGEFKKQKRSDDINKWDANFLNCPRSTLYELAKASYYLNIDGLWDFCKKKLN